MRTPRRPLWATCPTGGDHGGGGGEGWRGGRTTRGPLSVRLRRRGVRLWGAWVLAIVYFLVVWPDAASLWTGGAIILAGLIVRGWAAGVLEKDRELAVSGPYAFTRNPLYLGSFVIGVGAVVAGGRAWIGVVFLAFFVWAYRGAMMRENTRLEDRFGDGYRSYRRAVPAFMPRLTPYRPPAGTAPFAKRFSLSHYVRNREWEAALGGVTALGLLALKAAGFWGLPTP